MANSRRKARVSESSTGRIIRAAGELAAEETEVMLFKRLLHEAYGKVCQPTQERLSVEEIALGVRRSISNVYSHIRRWRKSR